MIARLLRHSLLLMCLLVLMCLSWTSQAVAAPPSQSATTIEMQGYQFVPQSITIPFGATITFKNTDQRAHTAKADNGAFGTGNIAAGAEKTIALNKAGTYAYYCEYHGGPGGVGMSGSIIVPALPDNSGGNLHFAALLAILALFARLTRLAPRYRLPEGSRPTTTE